MIKNLQLRRVDSEFVRVEKPNWKSWKKIVRLKKKDFEELNKNFEVLIKKKIWKS